MDPLEEFLSPEALRLLLDSDEFATTVDKPSVTTSDQSLSIITPLAAAVNTPIPDENRPTRKRLASDANITGCSTLVLDKAGSAKPKRAKFNAEGRAKVANVRKKGACMKCHRNKLPCSGEWPCESCCRSRAIVAGRASKHRWMDCVPFSMKDLDIFAREIVQNDHLFKKTLINPLEFINDDFWDVMQDKVEFTLKTESDANACYLRPVPIMRDWWTSVYNDARSTTVDRRLKELIHLLATISLINYPGTTHIVHGVDVEDIQNAQSVVGSRLLQCLEKALSNNSLSGFGLETLRALGKIICFTVFLVTGPAPRVQSFPDFYDRQRQLICVLAHHAVYIGERVDIWEGLDKETFIRGLSSIAWIEKPLHPDFDSKPHASNNSSHTLNIPFSVHNGHGKADNSFNQSSGSAENTSRGPIKRRDHLLEETSAEIFISFHSGRGDISQSTFCTEPNAVSKQEKNWAIVQGHANPKSLYLLDTQPVDRYRTFSDHDHIDHGISPNTAPPLRELQADTFCGWCGSFQISYKPSQGVVSCDICFTPYQPNNPTLPGWDPGQYRSTDQSFNPASGLDTSQGDSTNYAPWPDVTTSSSYGNDIDDFSWFMAS